MAERDPDKLIESIYNFDCPTFRRCGVFFMVTGKWYLTCCTVELLLPGSHAKDQRKSAKYADAFLFEDIITREECIKFIGNIQNGTVQFEDISLEIIREKYWESQQVFLSNDYMENSGMVTSIQAISTPTPYFGSPLISPIHPYYPDIDEAARNWLPFSGWYGASDGRKGKIIFLFQDERAFIRKLSFLNETTLGITIGGSELHQLSLIVKGAYWKRGQIYGIDHKVDDPNLALSVPHDCERLDFYLLDSQGTVYGSHKEDQHSPNKHVIGTFQHAEKSLVTRVKKAINEGEGERIEFKPFIDVDQQQKSPEHKTKFSEIVKTVVAFSNAKGGCIFLGIKDDCTLSVDNHDLKRYLRSEISEESIDQYLNDLKSRIKGSIDGDVNINLFHINLNGAVVALLEVTTAEKKPISIDQDNYYYLRVGASNKKISPHYWTTVLNSTF